MELKVSDLFAKRGYSFQWSARIEDQKILIKRIKEINTNGLDPKSLELLHIAEELEEFSKDSIASMTFIDYTVERVQNLGVTVN